MRISRTAGEGKETVETVSFPDCKDDMVDDDSWHGWCASYTARHTASFHLWLSDFARYTRSPSPVMVRMRRVAQSGKLFCLPIWLHTRYIYIVPRTQVHGYQLFETTNIRTFFSGPTDWGNRGWTYETYWGNLLPCPNWRSMVSYSGKRA